jgi:hypothetical protein
MATRSGAADKSARATSFAASPPLRGLATARSRARTGRMCTVSGFSSGAGLERSPLHDVRQHAPAGANPGRVRIDCTFRTSRITADAVMRTLAALKARTHVCGASKLRCDQASVRASSDAPVERQPVWWSQTGSNRRPPACKAGALPTELWPLQMPVVNNQ